LIQIYTDIAGVGGDIGLFTDDQVFLAVFIPVIDLRIAVVIYLEVDTADLECVQ
jgi:hypothetical protein